MDWMQVKIYTTTEGIDHVGGMLLMLGVNGYSVEDKNDFNEFLEQTEVHWDYVDESLDRLRDVESSVTFYLTDDENGRETLLSVRSELQRIKQEDTEIKLGRLELEISGIAQEDWENGWKKYFKPFTVGEELIIIPSWEKVPENNTRKVLTIDPGMSFGTGQHHTTRLCIEALEKCVFENSTVLDLGSGSGILSIASLLLGAKNATAVDIDPLAVDVSKENAALNGFKEDKYMAYRGNILADDPCKEKIKGKYDIVVANIVADVLIAFAPIFKDYMHKDSILICSGIIEHRLNDVKNALAENGYIITSQSDEAEWFSVRAHI